MFNYYNNETVRKLVIAVGTVFNNIHVMHKDKDGNNVDFKVPLTYAPKEKYIKRLTNPSSISNRTRVEISVPQMAFELTDILYDPARHLNKTNNRTQLIAGVSYASYTEVPYNFGFGLYAYTRNIEENLQIMEQILPYFSPEFVVSLNITPIHKKVDVPIVMYKTLLSQEYEGDFSNRRAVVSTYQFVAKSYIYNHVNQITPITEFSFDIKDFQGITYI
jgi:hypothetical protein